ncbi:rRNA maturation RNase YbeY [Rhodoflexus caldus]|uniref:rRNA maturation RNase YbeY n=1 Tax=Rhodoflexus caldus TaxID=2891236 RepID=UPI002029E5AC|nr:rRNA maturation RNase YbeY [Rhodoflexus caldus]
MSKKVHFFTENIIFKLPSKKVYKEWVAHMVENVYNKKVGELNYIFCSDHYLHSINMQYLNHDTLTDIITFDNSEPGSNEISGDVFISIERVTENAQKYNKEMLNELARVMIHGVLHLCGFKDKNASDQKIMRKEEDNCLQILDNMLKAAAEAKAAAAMNQEN